MEEDIRIICLFRNYENIFINYNLNNKKIELNKMNNINSNIKGMDLTKLSKVELLVKCEELGIVRCKSKNKGKLIELINEKEFPQILIPLNENEKMNENELSDFNTISNIQTKYTLVDLFCGTGAFSYAFHQTNKVSTIFANDMLDSSEKIFNLNNNIKLTNHNLIDIDDINIPKTDIITAGFPCQPFSIAGMQKGFDDERSNVFWKILSIIKNNNPKIVILENVKNLQSHDNGNTFNVIIDNLQKLNYHIKYSILNTSKITGIPQNRERIYIICFKDRIMCDNFNFDFPNVELKSVVDFLESNVSEKYYYDNSSAIYNKLEENVIKNVTTNTIYQEKIKIMYVLH